MVIRASKTEHHSNGGERVCPIFPELKPYLESAWDSASEAAVYVVERYKGQATSTNLRTFFESIISRAGLVQWPKLFQNLRARCETELMAIYPAKDVAAWLGNSLPVAMTHYAMATAESFQRAIQEGAKSVGANGGAICGSIPTGSEAISNQTEQRKNPEIRREIRVPMVEDGSSLNGLVGGTELESVTSTMSTLRSNQLS